MENFICHFCECLDGLIVLRCGETLCPKCFKNLYMNGKCLPRFVREQIREIKQINAYDPIGKQNAELVAFFVRNGMTISKVSRQMGITRSTVYKWLRKYDLINITAGDKKTERNTDASKRITP